jgi:hypothetical protein
MPSETSRSSSGDLLADVARATQPFLYRTTIYRLLGASAPDGGAINHAAPLPPVGFRYLARGVPGWFPSSAPAAGETGVRRPASPDGSRRPVGATRMPASNARLPERVPRSTAAGASADGVVTPPVPPASHVGSRSVAGAGVPSDPLRPISEVPRIDTRTADRDVDGPAALRPAGVARASVVSAPPPPEPPVTSLPAERRTAGASPNDSLAPPPARDEAMPREPSDQAFGPRASVAAIVTAVNSRRVGELVDDHGQTVARSASPGSPSARPIERASILPGEWPRAPGEASDARTLVVAPTTTPTPSTIDMSTRASSPVGLQPRPRPTLNALPYRPVARTVPDVVAATASRPDRAEARGRVVDPEAPRRPSQRLVPVPTARSLPAVPRSFWSSSGLRSRHLGVLR